MKRGLAIVLVFLGIGPGCVSLDESGDVGTRDAAQGGGGGGRRDLAFPVEEPEDLRQGGDIEWQDPNECGDFDPGCMSASIGPPRGQFPLSSDPKPNPAAGDTNVDRDFNGYLKLSTTHSTFNFLWVAIPSDIGGAGSISKLD